MLSCYPDVLRRKVKRVNIADTKSRDITFEGAFVCVCVCGEKCMWVTRLTQQVIAGEYLS